MMRTLESDETAVTTQSGSEVATPMADEGAPEGVKQEDAAATVEPEAHTADEASGDDHAGEDHKAEDHAAEDHAGEDHSHEGEGHPAHEGEKHSGDSHTGDDHDGEAHDGEAHDGDSHGHAHGFLDQGHLLGHVQDQPHFEFSFWLTGRAKNEGGQALHLGVPQLPAGVAPKEPYFGTGSSPLQPMDLKVTKFMVIEVLVAIALVAVFVPLARKISTGDRPRGRWWNLIESILVYVRDQIARPSIGHHDADKYLPYLWTCFFFVLFCNLFGLIPFLGSPTGSLGVTAVLAVSTFAVVVGTGVIKLGPIGFVKSQVPHMELPLILAIGVVPLIFVIEVMGLFIKHFVLAIRLFANMFAGHLVLAVLMAFIGEAWSSNMVYLVAPASLGAATAVNLLELFVAFLQAYIFTFLSALFIGSAAHPH